MQGASAQSFVSRALGLLSLAATLLVAHPAAAEPGTIEDGGAVWVEESGWRPQIGYADDKVRFEWKDKAQLAFGGLLQGDWGYIQQNSPVTPEGWHSEVRRGRLGRF